MDDLEQQLLTLREQAESDRALLHQLNGLLIGGEGAVPATVVDLTPIEARLAAMETRLAKGEADTALNHTDLTRRLIEHGHPTIFHVHPAHDHDEYALRKHAHEPQEPALHDHGPHAHAEYAKRVDPVQPHTHAEYAEHSHLEFQVLVGSIDMARKAWVQETDSLETGLRIQEEMLDASDARLAEIERQVLGIVTDQAATELAWQMLRDSSVAQDASLIKLSGGLEQSTGGIQSMTVDILDLTNRIEAQARLIVELQSQLNKTQPTEVAASEHKHPEFEALAAENRRHSHPNLDAWLTQNWQSIQDRLNALEGNPAPVS